MPTTPAPWAGFHNTRDLGGLPTADGGVTRAVRMVRSADLRFVTPGGWAAARAAGVRTVVDLRNPDELRPAPGLPADVEVVGVPLDDADDVEMWTAIRADQLDGSPLYYRPFLARKAERCAAALRAIARARPGGVLFHCSAGRDRRGLVALLLLSLAGVADEEIVADYECSTRELPALFAAVGLPDQGPLVERVLRGKGTTVRRALLDVLRDLDAEAYLRRAGLDGADLAALRARLVAHP